MSNNNELAEFIRDTLSQIDDGAGLSYVGSQIDFNIQIAKKVSAGGKVGVSVLGLGDVAGVNGNIENENASRVQFSVKLERNNKEYTNATNAKKAETEKHIESRKKQWAIGA